MCGLIALLSPGQPIDPGRFTSALASIRHRGPDGEGIACLSADGRETVLGDTSTRLALGFRRLAILDLSHGSDQPMRCPETGNILLFNGEIYNFLELRTELEVLGHKFRTEGDTEVILAAWREWGSAAFPRLNGMWAILIHDKASGQLIASRDRMGVKPLYFACHQGQVAFASEIRAILRLLAIGPPVNPGAAYDFLTEGEIDHHETTLYDGIVSVPAGGLWLVSASGRIDRSRYHDWPTDKGENSPERLRTLLNDSVGLRLRSDAPTVSLLSGGLDSSLVTWLASGHTHDPRTAFKGAFSYGYSSAAYAEHDEIARARRLIAALPTPVDHDVIEMDPVPDADELLAMTACQELPTTTPSVIAAYRLYGRIRERGIKVALSGEGADELFAGYTRLYMPLLAHDHLASGALGQAAACLRSPHLDIRGLARRTLWDLPQVAIRPLLRHARPNVASLAPTFWHAHRDRFAQIQRLHRLGADDRLREDVTVSNLPEILRYSDRNSMGASIEVRLPFMDYRLVEYGLGLPLDAKLGPSGGKQALRKAFAGVLPEAVLAQPKTHGFGNAEQHQVLDMKLSPLIERAPPDTWNFLDRAALARELARPHAHPMIWLPVSFMLWMIARHENSI